MNNKKYKIFKFKLFLSDDNKLNGIAVSNNKINNYLFKLLNNASHDAINKFNHNSDWINYYVKFTHDNKNYEQIDQSPNLKNSCFGCVFNDINYKCNHPHFNTKPYCIDKIYVEVVK